MNVIPDIFKDVEARLFSVKYTCAGGGIVAAAAGDRSVDDSAGGGNEDGSVAASDAGYGSVADAEGDGIVASTKEYGSVAAAAGDRSAVGRTGFSGGLGTGADGALRL